ncbi:MAG: bacillithiol biosynthesis deacetylase BshB1, partial [Acidobacteriota bacterium]
MTAASESTASEASRHDTVDVLAIGAHPDDIELGCGGTLALLAAGGRRIGLVHLTRGERGTRGTIEEREIEARNAAAALGAPGIEPTVDFLDCGDGSLRHGEAEEDALIEVLRRRRPELVLGPPPEDRHPDHGRSYRLVKDACFYAGLRRRAEGLGGEAHRPGAFFSYMQHDSYEPSFVVDVTSVWQQKIEALACYDSQLYRPDRQTDEPKTKVASQAFTLAVEGRARHFGQIINAELGEPFWSPSALFVGDPMQLVPGG